MEDRTPRSRRARPVSDVLVYLLLDRSADLAKGWLLELVQERPLERAQGLLAAGLASSGPRICEGIVRGLLSDQQLQQLQPGGALEPLLAEIGELVDARAPEEVSGALESLRGVIWSALRSELPDPDPELIWALSERLSLTLETVRAAALRCFAAPPVPPVPPPPLAPAEPPEPPLRASPRADVFSVSRAELPENAVGEAGNGAGSRPASGQAEAVGRQLKEEIAVARRRGAPLSLLLIELDEPERMLAMEGTGGPGFGAFNEAVRSAVRRHDLLATESESRAWVIARDSDGSAARALGLRIAEAIHAAAPWHGASLAVAIGVAMLGPDGGDSGSLMESAEQARFAASAAGVEIGPPEPGGR
jgi:GGDEF domain-containing protein